MSGEPKLLDSALRVAVNFFQTGQKRRGPPMFGDE